MTEGNIHCRVKALDFSLNERIVQDFDGFPDGFVAVGEKKWILPAEYKKFAEQFNNFKCRSSDVFICTHPRSGTTWTQEMVWLICNNLDYETASKVKLEKRSPYIDFHLISHEKVVDDIFKKNGKVPENVKEILRPIYDELEATEGRRTIKTHFAIEMLPENIFKVGSKIVYVARNPKDVVVSFFHLNRLFVPFGFNKDLETFVDYFLNDLLVYGPYWKHVKAGWNHRNDENVFFIFYEDLIHDLENSLQKLSIFLGNPLKHEDLPKLMNHLSFASFKENPAVNLEHFKSAHLFKTDLPGFIRKGKTKQCDDLTPELVAKIDKWTEKNLKDTDLRFPEYKK